MQQLCATSQWRPGTRRPGENARPRGVHAAGRRPRPGSSHGCNARKPDGEKRLLDGFPAPSTAQPGACLIVTNFLNLRPTSSTGLVAPICDSADGEHSSTAEVPPHTPDSNVHSAKCDGLPCGPHTHTWTAWHLAPWNGTVRKPRRDVPVGRDDDTRAAGPPFQDPEAEVAICAPRTAASGGASLPTPDLALSASRTGECEDLWLEHPQSGVLSYGRRAHSHAKNIKAILGAP